MPDSRPQSYLTAAANRVIDAANATVLPGEAVELCDALDDLDAALVALGERSCDDKVIEARAETLRVA